MNVNKTELPATKGFTTVQCRLWNMDHVSCIMHHVSRGAALIEVSMYLFSWKLICTAMLNDSFKTANGMKKEEEFEVHVQAAFV